MNLEAFEAYTTFATFEDWRNHAADRIGGIGLPNMVLLDAKQRPCLLGKDFMRAKEDGAYPVTVYVRRELLELRKQTEETR